MTISLGIVPINVGQTDGERLAAAARKAEEVGVESVWTFEHVVVPVEYDSRYPYSSKGKMPATPETPFTDPLITLAYVAAATKTLKLGTGIHILPQHNPLHVAKQVASLDTLSGGRFLFGVGVGWLEEEYDAMGTPFEKRGARFNDYLTAIKKVWSGEVVEHESERLNWTGFKSYPLPAQKPHPPLIIGGLTKPAMRRAARHGNGWFPANKDLNHLEQLLGELKEVCAAEQRPFEELEITAMSRLPRDAAELERLEAMNVKRLVLPLASFNTSDPIEALDKLAEGKAKLGI